MSVSCIPDSHAGTCLQNQDILGEWYVLRSPPLPCWGAVLEEGGPRPGSSAALPGPRVRQGEDRERSLYEERLNTLRLLVAQKKRWWSPQRKDYALAYVISLDASSSWVIGQHLCNYQEGFLPQRTPCTVELITVGCCEGRNQKTCSKRLEKNQQMKFGVRQDVISDKATGYLGMSPSPGPGFSLPPKLLPLIRPAAGPSGLLLSHNIF